MILILNCGSQSIKWKLFTSVLKLEKEGKLRVKNPGQYRSFLISELKKIKSLSNEIKIVGHRVVHGGGQFREPAKITPSVLEQLERYKVLAPLHQPFNLSGIKTAQKYFPRTNQWAVFDTGFFARLPVVAKTYSLPESLRKKYSLQRFGFHGVSHEYAGRQAARKLKKPFSKLKIITCHLGGGSSITAIKNGKPVDTSMGFTPLEGLVMMTRSGSIDPGILLYLKKEAGMDVSQLGQVLNFESGMKGICGKDDMLEILKAIKRKNKKAKLALDIFVYAIRKYIGAYYAVLNGCDALVFTGAIGFGSAKIRNMVCRNMAILKETKILAVEPNEEFAIAQEIKSLK